MWNWDIIKEKLLEGDDIKYLQTGETKNGKKEALSKILENVRDTVTDSKYLEISLNMNRMILPNLLANELAGVQALKSLNDTIYKMSTVFIPADWANKVVSNNTIDDAFETNRFHVQILKEKVEATEKFYNNTLFDEQINLFSLNGSMYDEIRAATCQNIISELDQQLLSKFRELAGEPKYEFDQSKISKIQNNNAQTFVGDEHAALAVLINRASNSIASRTRRGAGNKIVVSPTALTILQSASTSAFSRVTSAMTQNKYNFRNDIKLVGQLNNSMDVYVDTFAKDNTPVLVLYNGNMSGGMDSAITYCPYIPFKINNADDAGVQKLSYIDQTHAYVNSYNSLCDANNYIEQVGINIKTLKFT